MDVAITEKIIRDIFSKDEVGKDTVITVELGNFKRRSLSAYNPTVVSLQYSPECGRGFSVQHTISITNEEICKRVAHMLCKQIKSFKNLIDTYGY